MRRRTNKYKQQFDFGTIKLIICLVIFLAVFALKNINSHFTNNTIFYITEALKYNIDIEGTYRIIETFAGEKLGISIIEDEATPPNEEKYNIQNPKMTRPAEGEITSGFGMRKHPLSNEEAFHQGIDISCEVGTEVFAALDGRVVEVGENDGYGKYLKIEHENNLKTLYAHCSEILVSPNDIVTKEQKIALSGETGSTTGPNIHFEVIKDNENVNPEEFLNLE